MSMLCLHGARAHRKWKAMTTFSHDGHGTHRERWVVHSASSHGISSLTSLPKNREMHCLVRLLKGRQCNFWPHLRKFNFSYLL